MPIRSLRIQRVDGRTQMWDMDGVENTLGDVFREKRQKGPKNLH